jgi:hypothetical protein
MKSFDCVNPCITGGISCIWTERSMIQNHEAWRPYTSQSPNTV